MSDRVLVGLLIGVLSWTAPAALAEQRAQLVVFGDSLSDPGNHYARFGESERPPYEPVPAAPYRLGGFRFSNGPTWAEQLARRLHSPQDGGPALRSPHHANYAIGGARARGGDAGEWFRLAAQLERFSADRSGHAAPAAWHAIWIGSNDVRDALDSLAVDPSGASAQQISRDAVAAVLGAIGELYASGARRFLIVNVPDLGLTPALRAQPAAAPLATQLADGFNRALGAGLAALGDSLDDAQFAGLDVFSLLRDVAADPTAFGLLDSAHACLRFGVLRRTVCAHPDELLFWDGIHVTRAGHALLAELAERELRER